MVVTILQDMLIVGQDIKSDKRYSTNYDHGLYLEPIDHHDSLMLDTPTTTESSTTSTQRQCRTTPTTNTEHMESHVSIASISSTLDYPTTSASISSVPATMSNDPSIVVDHIQNWNTSSYPKDFSLEERHILTTILEDTNNTEVLWNENSTHTSSTRSINSGFLCHEQPEQHRKKVKYEEPSVQEYRISSEFHDLSNTTTYEYHEDSNNYISNNLATDQSNKRRYSMDYHIPPLAPVSIPTSNNYSISNHFSSLPFQVEMKTLFHSKYWRNGRKNIQCFPICEEFGDFYYMKKNNQTHRKPGVVCCSPIWVNIKSTRNSLHPKLDSHINRSFVSNANPRIRSRSSPNIYSEQLYAETPTEYLCKTQLVLWNQSKEDSYQLNSTSSASKDSSISASNHFRLIGKFIKLISNDYARAREYTTQELQNELSRKISLDSSYTHEKHVSTSLFQVPLIPSKLNINQMEIFVREQGVVEGTRASNIYNTNSTLNNEETWVLEPTAWKCHEPLRKVRRSSICTQDEAVISSLSADFYTFVVLLYQWNDRINSYQISGWDTSRAFEMGFTRSLATGGSSMNSSN